MAAETECPTWTRQRGNRYSVGGSSPIASCATHACPWSVAGCFLAKPRQNGDRVASRSLRMDRNCQREPSPPIGRLDQQQDGKRNVGSRERANQSVSSALTKHQIPAWLIIESSMEDAPVAQERRFHQPKLPTGRQCCAGQRFRRLANSQLCAVTNLNEEARW